MHRWLFIALLVALAAILLWRRKEQPAPAAYDHDRFGTQPADQLRTFAAFVSSFDGADDDTGDGIPDTLGIPQWVAYELRWHVGPIESGKRPRTWSTDAELAAAGLAPTDDTYRYTREFRSAHPNWYVRGHLAMKYHAERIGNEAAHDTHTLLNAVPQRAGFNSGIWQDLECRTGAWANQYGTVWIITGPVFYGGKPKDWLGEPEKGERHIAIPDALFKVVVKASGDSGRPDVLGFIYPQEDAPYARGPYPHEQYLASIDSIEDLTGLDLLSTLDEKDQKTVETRRLATLWPAEGRYFSEGCKRSRSYAAK
jgi:endonuclease G, mitochondrial